MSGSKLFKQVDNKLQSECKAGYHLVTLYFHKQIDFCTNYHGFNSELFTMKMQTKNLLSKEKSTTVFAELPIDYNPVGKTEKEILAHGKVLLRG